MALIQKQMDNIIDVLIGDAIKNGRLPSQSGLMRELRERANRISGAPVFRPLSAGRLNTFDVASWNRELSNCEFDVNILFEELIDQAILLMKRTGWTDTVYKAQRGQLDRLLAALNDVLFTQQNAEDHFVGFSETFTDYSKVDLVNTTPGAVSLKEKVLLIPSTPTGTKRIRLEDKLRSEGQVIQINEPEQTNVVRSATASDGPFHNIFHDVSLIWRHDIITRNDKGCEIQVDFPIDDRQNAHRITRVSITPTSETEMKAKIFYSYDGQNYTLLPTKAEWVSLEKMAKETALDFEGTTMRFFRIILRKEQPDEEVGNDYRYSFGIKNFSIFNAARKPQAEYRTVVMQPQHGTIEKVVLETDQYTPGGCEIDYYVADETGDFLPIAPLGMPNARAPQVVRFGDVKELWARFDGSGDLNYSYNAVDYFSINNQPVSGEYHFGMSQMLRGRDAWSRESSVIEETNTAKDTFIQFTRDDQKLYTYKASNVTGEDLVAVDGSDRTVLTVPSGDFIYYDRNTAGHLIRPNVGTDVDSDEQPKYAVAQVLAVRSAYTVTGEVHTATLGSSQWASFDNLNVDENTRPIIHWSTDGNIWNGPLREDSSYKLEKWPGEGDYLTGRIKLVKDSLAGSADPVHWRASYTVRRDITHLVRDVDVTKGQVWLAHPITADKYVTRYRVVPDNIIRKSVVVTERHGEDQGIVYQEGSDYIVNVSKGTISRLEGSRIDTAGSCYVDYQWVEEKYSLETFSAWCYYDRVEPTTIKFSSPTLDVDGGETFYMDIDGGRLDLLAANETPILSRGWYRFTTESKSLATSSPGIKTILQLVDRDGLPIFSGNAYFSEIRAFRAPMRQVSESKLKFGTRKGNHSTFSIDADGYVVVNFNPGNSTDLTTLLYDLNSDTLVKRAEFFELLRVTTSKKTPTGIRLRAILRRNPNVDPGTTPKVFGWALRISR